MTLEICILDDTYTSIGHINVYARKKKQLKGKSSLNILIDTLKEKQNKNSDMINVKYK